MEIRARVVIGMPSVCSPKFVLPFCEPSVDIPKGLYSEGLPHHGMCSKFCEPKDYVSKGLQKGRLKFVFRRLWARSVNQDLYFGIL